MTNDLHPCIICGKLISSTRKTCSKECLLACHRLRMQKRWHGIATSAPPSDESLAMMREYANVHDTTMRDLIASVLTTLNHEYILDAIVDGEHYDIAVPALKLLVCADASMNNVAFRDVADSIYMHRRDGYYKSLHAAKQGWRCVHWYDWDDIFKLPLLFANSKPIYARECRVAEISKADSDVFMNMYHLQKARKGTKFALGLFYEGDLIQVMAFGYPQFNKHYEWEIFRFCSDPVYRVIGGVSKLFAHFITIKNPESVITYCDASKFTGGVYSKIGMQLKSFIAPSIIWSKGTEKMPTNILTRFSYDGMFGTHYGPEANNQELMILNGWLPVYNCGQYVYHWLKATPCI